MGSPHLRTYPVLPVYYEPNLPDHTTKNNMLTSRAYHKHSTAQHSTPSLLSLGPPLPRNQPISRAFRPSGYRGRHMSLSDGRAAAGWPSTCPMPERLYRPRVPCTHCIGTCGRPRAEAGVPDRPTSQVYLLSIGSLSGRSGREENGKAGGGGGHHRATLAQTIEWRGACYCCCRCRFTGRTLVL